MVECRRLIAKEALESLELSRRRREPFLAWPGWTLLAWTVLLALLVTVWWIFIYHGANRLTELRSYRVRVHLDGELAMPFVPPFILIYVSMNLVFVPAPFILRSRRELEALAVSLAVVTAVAGIGFLLFPAELAYRHRDPGRWAVLFALAREMALSYNLVPSLHVALSSTCLAAYATHCGLAGKLVLATWGFAIVLSTLLTHQHHLLDVVTGLGLAAVAKRFIYDYWRARPPGLQKPPASPCACPGPSL
jgi:membrane-associated phospholipid phosphatase